MSFSSSSHSIVVGVVVKKNKNGSAKFKVRCSRYLYVCPPSSRNYNHTTRDQTDHSLLFRPWSPARFFMLTDAASSGTHLLSTTRRRLQSLSAICPRPSPPVSIPHLWSFIFLLRFFFSLLCAQLTRASISLPCRAEVTFTKV